MISLKGSCVLLLIAFPLIFGQQPAFHIDKPGACPRQLPSNLCYEQQCMNDMYCPGQNKCCETACGGHVCTTPMVEIQYGNNNKPGYCPVNPTGPWICTGTCSVDNDCRRNHKCCRNRCGALTCQAPQLNLS